MVIVESFERIHRSNLVGMGVLPLQFKDGDTRHTLGLNTDDIFSIRGLADLVPGQDITVEVMRADGTTFTFIALCRIDTANEMEYYRHGGILHYVLRKLAA
jgi:aconitate hydratase